MLNPTRQVQSENPGAILPAALNALATAIKHNSEGICDQLLLLYSPWQ
jgi:hypothetical protein